MKKNLDIIRTRRTGNIIAISIIVSFGLLAVMRLYPFENSLTKICNGPDDWRVYARYALDIKHHGLSLPLINGIYFKPAGFLYNYFLAFCFYVFGENTMPVYLIQSLLLGFSVALIYWAFRTKMKPLTGLTFLLSLSVFALLDISKNYSFRFLSENLTIFTISVFFFCFIKGIEKNKLLLQLAAAFFLGLSILTRPNIFPFGIVLVFILSFYYLKQKKLGILHLLLFIVVFFLSTSFLALRNHYVCGSWAFLPTEGISFGSQIFQQYDFSIVHFLKKILFCFGILSPLEPDYQWRPHWIIMWIAYFVYLFIRIKEDRKFELWEVSTHLYIFCYYGVLILVAPKVGSYGFRFLIPAIFIVMPFSFMVFDKLKNKADYYRSKFGK